MGSQSGDHVCPSVELQTSAASLAAVEPSDVIVPPLRDRDVIDLDSIGSLAALAGLTAMQMKDLLADNFANVPGLVDSRGLLSRASLLWRDHTAYREELATLRGDQLCQVCNCDPIECLVIDCSHLGMCTACAREAKQLNQCPFCYGPVSEIRRVFRVPVFTGAVDAPGVAFKNLTDSAVLR